MIEINQKGYSWMGYSQHGFYASAAVQLEADATFRCLANEWTKYNVFFIICRRLDSLHLDPPRHTESHADNDHFFHFGRYLMPQWTFDGRQLKISGQRPEKFFFALMLPSKVTK